LHKRLFSPLKCLVTCCHELEKGKKTTPQCPSDSYEIQELREAILNLLKKNQSLYEKKHDMFKEITHQLKSPIAIMQARLSTLTEEASHESLTDYVKETNMDIESIKELIHELLFLEEVKLDIQNTYKSTISMKSVFQEMQQKFQPLLELNQITIDADWKEDFTIYSFKQPILQVIQAMYENVSVHTKKGTTIEMRIDAAKKTLIISNIPKEKEDNLFKSTNIGTKIIKRLSDELDFSVITEHHKDQYITMITFHS
jgi:signal transduction histidine kinase